MGWVLRHPGATERVLIRNLPACSWFSAVTIAFQFFFMGWMMARLGWPAAVLGGTITVLMGVAIGPGVHRMVHALGFGVLTVSLWALWSLWKAGELNFEPFPLRDDPGLLWMAPVCLFGFALCPYLDQTFHRARRMNPGWPGTIAFTLGFGVVFPAMILFTLGYTGLIGRATPIHAFADLASSPVALLAAHIMAQLAFTIHLHRIELVALSQYLAERRGRPRPMAKRIRSVLILIAIPLAIGVLGHWAGPVRGMAFNEVVYRVFMAFYGLVFPAYVWLCMIPTRDGHSGLRRDKARVWLFAVGMAAPMYWMAFIEGYTWFLGVGLAVVMLARLFLPRDSTSAERAGPRTA